MTIAELQPVPHFAYGDDSRLEEAMQRFAGLGVTEPMVSVRFEDIGRLARLDIEGMSDDCVLDEEQAADYGHLVARAFDYFAGAAVLQLAVATWAGEPYPFWVDGTAPVAVRKRVDETGVDWHNDISSGGRGAIVYAAHLTLRGSGVVTAALAPRLRTDNAGTTSFYPAAEPTHSRSFVAGDMHIHVRQAPAGSRQPSDGRLIAPTTHAFDTTADRIYVERSFGFAADWRGTRPPTQWL